MGTINELNTTDTLAGDDKLVIWKDQAGATRAITAEDAAAYFSLSGGPYQPLDELLTAIAGQGPNTANGDFIQLTGMDTVRVRKLTVANYAALTVIPASFRFDDMLVYVASRATDGDGGDGWWRFDAASSAAANGGTILAPDAGTGRWIRFYYGPINAMWFGLKADALKSSAAANTTALQAALNAAYWVLLPEGTTYIRQIAHTQSNRLTGQGIGKTNLILDDDQNTRAFYAASLSLMVYEDFTLDMNPANNTGSGAHDGIRLEACVSPVVRRVRVTGARGLFSGSPVGGGISLQGGSFPVVEQCYVDDCFDGLQIFQTTDGKDTGCQFSDNLRFGIVGTEADRWHTSAIRSTGNATTYSSGGNYGFVDSLDLQIHGAQLNGSILSFGGLLSGCDNAQCSNIEANDNGLDGFGPYDSLNVQISGFDANRNVVRGITIDSGSNNCNVTNVRCRDNGDVDFSLFRSAGFQGANFDYETARFHEAAVALSATVAAGGSGYTDGTHTALVEGGTIGPLGKAAFTVTVSGGAIVSVDAMTNSGEYWDLPTNPVSVSGVPGGTGGTLNVVWAGASSQTVSDPSLSNSGSDTSTLTIATDPSGGGAPSSTSGALFVAVRGTITDESGDSVVAAVGCPDFKTPLLTLTLANSWVAYDPNWQEPVYWKDAEGWVTVQGSMSSGTTTPGTTIATLPVGYRPSKVSGPYLSYGASIGAIYVSSTGDIVINSTLDATLTAFVIRFQAA